MEKENLCELIELINSVKAANNCNEVEVLCGGELYNTLKALGDFKCREIAGLDESKILVIPAYPKPLKFYEVK